MQGTATDFYSTVSRELASVDAGRNRGQDWEAFVEVWRSGYFEAGEQAPDASAGEWVTVHSLYRKVLDGLLDIRGVAGWMDADSERATAAWRRLEPWPDTVPGLDRLRGRFTVATLSNADVSAIVEMSKAGGIRWDAVFTAEMAGVFKPDPRIYRMAAQYLGLPPERIMMVACHKYDLRAAAALGFRTAFVARPLELGARGDVDVAYEPVFDVNAADFLDLATQLGC